VVDYTLFAMDGPRGTGPGHPFFDVRERRDADGAVRMTLTGELDLSASAGLKARVGEVQRAQHRVRLDLSQLEFIDCSGIRAILDAMAEARGEGRRVEVDRAVSPVVRRILSLGAIDDQLWPGEARPAIGAAPVVAEEAGSAAAA
jgi:anti-anti-sigma factor